MNLFSMDLTAAKSCKRHICAKWSDYLHDLWNALLNTSHKTNISLPLKYLKKFPATKHTPRGWGVDMALSSTRQQCLSAVSRLWQFHFLGDCVWALGDWQQRKSHISLPDLIHFSTQHPAVYQAGSPNWEKGLGAHLGVAVKLPT